MVPQFSKNTLLGFFLLLALYDIASAMYVTKVRRLPLSAISYRQGGLIGKRALDALEGSGFSGLNKRALDMLDGAGFGMEKKKRALDSLEGSGFSFKKRALDMLEGTGFNSLNKRSAFEQDRYTQILEEELTQLEMLKQELRDELRRRRMLAEEAQLLK